MTVPTDSWSYRVDAGRRETFPEPDAGGPDVWGRRWLVMLSVPVL